MGGRSVRNFLILKIVTEEEIKFETGVITWRTLRESVKMIDLGMQSERIGFKAI